MTLTTWLRVYLFTPLSRSVMRRGGPRFDGLAIVVSQIWAMVFCGLWHGLRWEFALWGFCHALGLIWCSLGARQAGAYLPRGFLLWWRGSAIGYGASCFLGVTTFTMINVIALGDFSSTASYFAHLLGLR